MSIVLPFYSHTRGPHRAFSNFYTPAPFTLKTADLLAPSDLTSTQKQHIIDVYGEKLHMLYSEQAFMLGKVFAHYFEHPNNSEVAKAIMSARKPAKAKALGGRGSLQGFSDARWHPVREEIMYTVCLAKFQQNADLK